MAQIRDQDYASTGTPSLRSSRSWSYAPTYLCVPLLFYSALWQGGKQYGRFHLGFAMDMLDVRKELL